MSEQSQGPGWWLASDGRWYAPEQVSADQTATAAASAVVVTPNDPTPRRTLLPTGNAPTQPAWDGTTWVSSDGAGTSYRWDGTAWQVVTAPVAAPAPPPVPAVAAPVPGAAPAPGMVEGAIPVPPAATGSTKVGLALVVGVVVVALLVVSVVVLRSRGGSGFATGIPFAGPDEDPRDKVSLTDDVVVVRGGAGSVRSVSADHTTYTLDANAPGVADLAQGKVALIAGLDAGRVRSIERNGADAVVALDAVAITEVVKDGSFSWDDAEPQEGQALAFVGAPVAEDATDPTGSGGEETTTTTAVEAQPSSYTGSTADTAPTATDTGTQTGTGSRSALPPDTRFTDDGVPLLPVGFRVDDPTGSPAPADALVPGESAGGPIEGAQASTTTTSPQPETSLTMRIKGWEVGFSATKAGSGLDLELTAKKGVKPGPGADPVKPGAKPDPLGDPDSDTGALELGVTVKMHLNEAKHSGKFDVSGGSITNFSAHAPMSGFAEATASAKTEQAQQFPKSIVIKVPIAYEWPVFIYGIPFYVYVQSSFLIQPSLSTKTTGMEIPVRVDLKGDAGVTYTDGKGNNDGTTVEGDMAKKPLDTLNATPSIGAMALVFAVQAPRIGFGIGTTAYAAGARAGVYFDFVTSLGITVGPSTAIVACRAVSLTMTASVGGEIKIKFWAPDSEATVGVKYPLKKKQLDWYEPEVPACKL